MVQHARSWIQRYLDKKQITTQTLFADLIAGLTVALILIPQSLAYAQLAGLPSQYGLYAAFLPPAIATIFGSSRFLSTGPVAVVSLMTASVLGTLPINSVSEFVMYAAILALMVGVIQLLLGTFKLGVIVHFISHPVMLGFTNAAALIIATSQLPKIFGVTVDNYNHHYETIFNFVVGAIRYTHWLSVAIAIIAFCIIILIRRLNARLPGILFAVILCTLLSIFIKFDQHLIISKTSIRAPDLWENVYIYNSLIEKKLHLSEERNFLVQSKNQLIKTYGYALPVLETDAKLVKVDFELKETNRQIESYRKLIRAVNLLEGMDENGISFYQKAETSFFRHFAEPIWKIQVNEKPIDEEFIKIQNGGSIIGSVPAGLPQFKIPKVTFPAISALLNGALIIAVIGFMQSYAMARSLAVKNSDRIDPNRELRGQGLANMVAGFTQSFPVAGSFSLTAVNYESGAHSKYSRLFTTVVILITLLFLTPLLYYLPQAVLAVVIVMSVMGLFSIEKLKHAWQANRNECIIALITFVSTLFYAPHLDRGILLGVVISTSYYIYTRTRPKIVQLSADKHDTLHDIELYHLTPCKHIALIRFDGSLFFANTNYLENNIESIVNDTSRDIRAVILLADGINYIDYSGVEALAHLAKSYRENGLHFYIATIKSHILKELKKTYEFKDIGENNVVLNEQPLVKKIYHACHEHSDESHCPLQGYIS